MAKTGEPRLEGLTFSPTEAQTNSIEYFLSKITQSTLRYKI